MDAFSTRERRKIIALYRQGWETQDIAQRFAASVSGVRRPKLDEAGRQQLLLIAQRRPDAFCHELAEDVEREMGVKVTRQTIGQWLRELGVTRKKSRSTPASSSVRM